ncbi:MAG TPA: CPBP family intramembrane metalloprotease domain-containing protein [Cytophagales bacterium]|nr:CPBP family intramembrane metalloprotease domain-containing protein [Cytophagales bacterium]
MIVSNLTENSGKHPLVMATLTLLVAGIGFLLVGPLIGFFISTPFFDGTILEQAEKMADPMSHEEFRVPLYLMQGCATLIGLAVLPIIFTFGAERKGLNYFFGGVKNYGIMFLLLLILTIAFMATNSVLISWNANLHFPDFMNGFETWARNYESKAEALTKFMTQFESGGEFLLAFVVIAIFPAVSEELLFRGMLQRQLHQGLGNIHVAIWTSAILFSAFHLQFFGFVPRLLLGGLFGYLYYWSGNLWMPIFAHFVNNGFSVVMIYLNQKGVVDMDVESTDTVAPWPAVVASAFLVIALLYYFKLFFDRKNQIHG